MYHRRDVEKLIGYFSYEQLAGYDDGDYGPESAAHFQGEYAFSGFKGARVEHIPEMRPYENRKQKCHLVGGFGSEGADCNRQHLRQ